MSKIIYGLYDDEEVLVSAAKELKENRVKVKDVYSPFPIHGIDDLIGVPRTRLGICSFIYGACGLTLAWLLMAYTMIWDWMKDIGGKPSFTFNENLVSFVPVSFEMTVFCAAHGMALTFLLRSMLFPGQKEKNPDPRTTDDKFLIEIKMEENSLSEERIKSILQSNGAIEINEDNQGGTEETRKAA